MALHIKGLRRCARAAAPRVCDRPHARGAYATVPA